jgi:hypothetical protein
MVALGGSTIGVVSCPHPVSKDTTSITTIACKGNKQFMPTSLSMVL